MIDIEALREINYIIEHDATSSTYKYVLLRSVINATQKYEHLINIENSKANIPLGLIIEQWILDYMPFVFQNIRQQNNGSVLDSPIETTYTNIFELLHLNQSIEWEYAYMQFFKALQNPSPKLSTLFFRLSKQMARKIVTMPMKFTGLSQYGFFKPNRYQFREITLSKTDIFNTNFLIVNFDTFSISEQHYNIFRYLGQTLYGTSTIMSKWKQKTNLLNANQTISKNIIDKLSGDTLEVRETNTIRNLLPNDKVCVWSGKKLQGENYDVDHVLPFSVWFNNDLWNMLPTDRKLNQQKKKHKIPTRKLIKKRANIIMDYWNLYKENIPLLFNSQIKVALVGQDEEEGNEFELAIESLCTKSDYLIYDRGHEKFEI
jgi:hypothetical protein